jgi:hypothetical protein
VRQKPISYPLPFGDGLVHERLAGWVDHIERRLYWRRDLIWGWVIFCLSAWSLIIAKIWAYTVHRFQKMKMKILGFHLVLFRRSHKQIYLQ